MPDARHTRRLSFPTNLPSFSLYPGANSSPDSRQAQGPLILCAVSAFERPVGAQAQAPETTLRLGLRSAEEYETDPADRLHEVISMLKLDHETILLAFAVVTGLAMLLQTIMLLAITVALRKAAISVREETENLRTSVMPVIYDTRDLVATTQIVLTSAQEFVSSAQAVLNRRSEEHTSELQS